MDAPTTRLLVNAATDLANPSLTRRGLSELAGATDDAHHAILALPKGESRFGDDAVRFAAAREKLGATLDLAHHNPSIGRLQMTVPAELNDVVLGTEAVSHTGRIEMTLARLQGDLTRDYRRELMPHVRWLELLSERARIATSAIR